MTSRCWDVNLNPSLPSQLFEHLIMIFQGPTERELYIEWCYGVLRKKHTELISSWGYTSREFGLAVNLVKHFRICYSQKYVPFFLPLLSTLWNNSLKWQWGPGVVQVVFHSLFCLFKCAVNVHYWSGLDIRIVDGKVWVELSSLYIWYISNHHGTKYCLDDRYQAKSFKVPPVFDWYFWGYS